jgi:hypothetical protein
MAKQPLLLARVRQLQDKTFRLIDFTHDVSNPVVVPRSIKFDGELVDAIDSVQAAESMTAMRHDHMGALNPTFLDKRYPDRAFCGPYPNSSLICFEALPNFDRAP